MRTGTVVDRPSHLGKIRNIQALRALAAILVVFYHLTSVDLKYGNGTAVLPAWFGYGACGVDLFFVISGFVMVTVTAGKPRSLESVRRFLIQRATRIYPLYWFYSLIVLAIFLTKPSMVSAWQGTEVNVVRSFLLLPDSAMPLLNVGWSLIFEGYFYLVFSALLLLKSDRHQRVGLVIWAVIVSLGLAATNWTNVESGPVVKVMTHYLTYEFIAGCCIGELIQANRTRYAGIAVGLGVGMFAVLCLMHDPALQTQFESTWRRVVVFGIPAALVVYGVVSLEVSRGVFISSWMEFIGDASYSIYLSHVLVLSLLGRIWWATQWNGPVQSRLSLALMVVVVIACGLLSYVLVERPLLALTRRQRVNKT